MIYRLRPFIGEFVTRKKLLLRGVKHSKPRRTENVEKLKALLQAKGIMLRFPDSLVAALASRQVKTARIARRPDTAQAESL